MVVKLKDIIEKIYNYSLEEIMGERFGRYSKYIIQDRAIPDVRDGLKPVQRRILYSMHESRNTHDKPTRKSAKAVGEVIGHYHPHGDSSIYDAMVRLSQDWKMRVPLIDMQGNNGSIDGDPPAAMRYTEARLSKISKELLTDIEKDTVIFAPTYDDATTEPTVLPAKYPNLLVNGTTGISAGYATNIPPHNLEEIIDATIKRIDSPNCKLETILEIVKGPDFPTGGIVLEAAGIKQAFETGKGRVVVRSKVDIVTDKKQKQLIITQIPYEVIKTNIVKKIDEIRVEKLLPGLLEVRDESDKDGLRIALDIKKEASCDLILNYLYKNTELQTYYNYNMIAIVNRRPKQLGIIQILDAYISHFKEVITNRTLFDLAHPKKRLHIVEGLIKAVSILDEVIATIRASKNKKDAIDNLCKEYGFTSLQADAIVMLQLYRLTNTDVTLLEEEMKNLLELIEKLSKIINEEEELHKTMKEELRFIKKEYGTIRKTEIRHENADIKIDTQDMIAKEDVVVLITKDGYVKRTSKRGYLANSEEPLLKENDYVIGLYDQNTLDTLLVFTNLGNYLYLPVHEIPDIKWRSLGKHISNIIKMEEKEEIVSAISISDFQEDTNIIIATEKGMIKKTHLSEFKVSRYSKPITCMKLKNNDQVINAFISNNPDIMMATSHGYSLWFDESEIPTSGIKSSGVKSIALKNDTVVAAIDFDKESEYVTVFTDKETAKRVKLEDFEKGSRARRGLMILKEVKSNPYRVLNVFINESKTYFGLKKEQDIAILKNTEISISDRYKTGGAISKEKVLEVFLIKNLEKRKDITNKEIEINPEVKEPNSIENAFKKVAIVTKKEKETEVEIEENLDEEELRNPISDLKDDPITKESPRKAKINYQMSLLEIDETLAKIDDLLK